MNAGPKAFSNEMCSCKLMKFNKHTGTTCLNTEFASSFIFSESRLVKKAKITTKIWHPDTHIRHLIKDL